MARRKTFHHGNLKLALTDAALALLDEDGIVGVTIRAVAAKAGVSHAAPANHFKDRKALLTNLARTEFDGIWLAIQDNLASGPDSRVRTFFDTMADYAFAFPDRYELLWRSDLVDHSDSELETVLDAIYSALCSELAQENGATLFDIDTIAVALWSMMHGYISLRLSGMFEPANDRITGEPRFEAMMSLLLGAAQPKGVNAPSRKPRRAKA